MNRSRRREIRNHTPGEGKPDGYEHFGDKHCTHCGDAMYFHKHKSAGQGGIYSCRNGMDDWEDSPAGPISNCCWNVDVYINHCCRCNAMIDSRYCKIDAETGVYYCAVCGALCDESGLIGEYDPSEQSNASSSLASEGPGPEITF